MSPISTEYELSTQAREVVQAIPKKYELMGQAAEALTKIAGEVRSLTTNERIEIDDEINIRTRDGVYIPDPLIGKDGQTYCSETITPESSWQIEEPWMSQLLKERYGIEMIYDELSDLLCMDVAKLSVSIANLNHPTGIPGTDGYEFQPPVKRGLSLLMTMSRNSLQAGLDKGCSGVVLAAYPNWIIRKDRLTMFRNNKLTIKVGLVNLATANRVLSYQGSTITWPKYKVHPDLYVLNSEQTELLRYLEKEHHSFFAVTNHVPEEI